MQGRSFGWPEVDPEVWKIIAMSSPEAGSGRGGREGSSIGTLRKSPALYDGPGQLEMFDPGS